MTFGEPSPTKPGKTPCARLPIRQRPFPLLKRDDPPAPSAEPPPEPLSAEIAEALPQHGRTALAALARRWLLRIVPVVLLVAAVWVLWREFHHLSVAAVARS